MSGSAESFEDVPSCSLHGISPYVGRLAAHRAKELVDRLALPGGTVADPFCGSGTVPLEAWRAGMKVLACDLSPYAVALTRAKLFPIATLEKALNDIEEIDISARRWKAKVDLKQVPAWVGDFYHPETLREAIAWSHVLRSRKAWFLFGCFLNLLHHQRPGFLSYPASHATPYLRRAKFPLDEFPDMYTYRDVKSRLEKKVRRTLKKLAHYDHELERTVKLSTTSNLRVEPGSVSCIITSPPYMSGLDYARDNRLRLWFCGVSDWTCLENSISPSKNDFASLMTRSARAWQKWLAPSGNLAIVLGDIHQDKKRIDVAKLVMDKVQQIAPGLDLVACEDQTIPDEKRLIKGKAGTVTETTVIFRRRK